MKQKHVIIIIIIVLLLVYLYFNNKQKEHIDSTVTMNKKMRLFSMGGLDSNNHPRIEWVNQQYGVKIVDPSGNNYNSSDWVCIVAGIYLPKDQTTTTSGSKFARTFLNDNNEWVVNFFEGGTETDYIRHRSVINILAIPKEISESVKLY